MNVQHLKVLGGLALSSIAAVFIGYSLAAANYELLVLLVAFAVFLFVLLTPDYGTLLALGLLSPFNLPVPFIRGFPLLLLILLTCLVKYSIRRWLTHRKDPGRKGITPLAFGLFFAWILVRYCLNPSLPNVSGFGDNVTGFRAYLNYSLCFGIIWLMGRVIQTQADVMRLMRRLATISAILVILLISLMFTKSITVASILTSLGAYVTSFDNGMLRFVVLPGFGLILVTFALLPRLFPSSKYYRMGMLGLGTLAVVFGGNRSSVLMLFAILCTIPLLKRRFLQFVALIGCVVLCLGAFSFMGENIKVREFGVLRILALTSDRVATETGADYNVYWRKLRWNRAIEEIRNNPWVGKGYGGLENAFVWANWANFADASVEIDIASGGIHNGYLACALALGIPAAVFFVGFFLWQAFVNGKRALKSLRSAPFVSELHIMVCANLIAFALTIYIGSDVNTPMLWFYFALGLIAHRLYRVQTPATPTTESHTARAFSFPSFRRQESLV